MSLKKNLKTGQAVVEYFIIFAAIGALTIIGVSSFLEQIKLAGWELYRTATISIRN